MPIFNFLFIIFGFMFSIFTVIVQSKEKVLKGGFKKEHNLKKQENKNIN
jgi:hypothetical protein